MKGSGTCSDVFACSSRFEQIFNVANDRTLPSGNTEDLVIRADDSFYLLWLSLYF